jgi:GNAT superfamily N-acetyltransferase
VASGLVEPPPARMPPAGHPTEVEGEAVTAYGTRVILRSITPDDASRLVDFHRGLSPRSVYRRFFFAHPTLADAEIERFTEVDHVDRVALVAVVAGQLVAVGRYERAPGSMQAEVAFVVADDYQHHGLAPLLLGRLAEVARQNGIAVFTAETLVENSDMIGVFQHSGFPVTTHSEFDIVSVRCSIGVPAPAFAARPSVAGHPG